MPPEQNCLITSLQKKERIAFRLKEVSAAIGVPVSTLRSMIRRGEINPVTAFGSWLITAADLEQLLTRRLR